MKTFAAVFKAAVVGGILNEEVEEFRMEKRLENVEEPENSLSRTGRRPLDGEMGR